MSKPLDTPSPSQRAKVLIADDDPALRKLLSKRIEAAGFDVATGCDGYATVLMAIASPPQALILDIDMPAGNGFEVLKRVRAVPDLRSLPIIFLTGHSSPRIERIARRIGAYAVVHKPFEFDQLLDTLGLALGFNDRLPRRRATPNATCG